MVDHFGRGGTDEELWFHDVALLEILGTLKVLQDFSPNIIQRIHA